MFGSGLVSRVRASHRVNLIAPFSLDRIVQETYTMTMSRRTVCILFESLISVNCFGLICFVFPKVNEDSTLFIVNKGETENDFDEQANIK